MNYFRSLLTAQAHGLLLPKEHKASVERYVAMHQVTTASPERMPFRRQLDFWAFSLVTALAKGLSPLEDASSKWGERFIDTQHVDMGDDLCALLAVVALAKFGYEHEDVANPRRIIDLANRLAAVGCPLVLNKLGSNALRSLPLDRAIEFARELRDEACSE
jgi:hypothetical protein